VDGASVNGRRRYRLTPASLEAGRVHGFGPDDLENWFLVRAGRPSSAAALLIQTGKDAPAFEVRRQVVLHVPNEELADGMEQWPATRGFIKARLGPRALVIEEADAKLLQERLGEIGVSLHVD
jgi:hypothetical protein